MVPWSAAEMQRGSQRVVTNLPKFQEAKQTKLNLNSNLHYITLNKIKKENKG